MRRPPDSDIPPNNHTSHHTTTNSKLKIVAINVNGLNNTSKRNKIFNFLKTKKVDITLLLEIHLLESLKDNGKKSGPVFHFRLQNPRTKLQG